MMSGQHTYCYRHHYCLECDGHQCARSPIAPAEDMQAALAKLAVIRQRMAIAFGTVPHIMANEVSSPEGDVNDEEEAILARYAKNARHRGHPPGWHHKCPECVGRSANGFPVRVPHNGRHASSEDCLRSGCRSTQFLPENVFIEDGSIKTRPEKYSQDHDWPGDPQPDLAEHHRRELLAAEERKILSLGEAGWKSQWYTGSGAGVDCGQRADYNAWRYARDEFVMRPTDENKARMLSHVSFTNPPEAGTVKAVAGGLVDLLPVLAPLALLVLVIVIWAVS